MQLDQLGGKKLDSNLGEATLPRLCFFLVSWRLTDLQLICHRSIAVAWCFSLHVLTANFKRSCCRRTLHEEAERSRLTFRRGGDKVSKCTSCSTKQCSTKSGTKKLLVGSLSPLCTRFIHPNGGWEWDFFHQLVTLCLIGAFRLSWSLSPCLAKFLRNWRGCFHKWWMTKNQRKWTCNTYNINIIYIYKYVYIYIYIWMS